MENKNESEVKTKNITLGSIVAWVLGVFAILAGIGLMSSKPAAGIIWLIIAIVVLPPVSKLVKNKLHFSLSKGVKIVAVIILIGVAGSLGISGSSSVASTNSSTANTSSGSQPVATQPAIKVSASKILADYKANEVSADGVYKGNTVDVTGVVDTIGKDFTETPYIDMNDGSPYSFSNVHCFFSSSDEPQLAKVTKGQSITLEGQVSGLVVGNVVVNNCQIAK